MMQQSLLCVVFSHKTTHNPVRGVVSSDKTIVSSEETRVLSEEIQVNRKIRELNHL